MKKGLKVFCALLMLLFFCVGAFGCNNNKRKYQTDELGEYYLDKDGNKVYELVMYEHGLYFPEEYEHRDDVLEELNRRLLEDLGYKIDIQVYSYPDDQFETKINTDIAGGKVIDLFRVGSRENLVNYVYQGVLIEITDEVKNLDAMNNYLLSKNPNIWLETTMDGKIYGVPAPAFTCWRGNYIRGDYLRKMGMVDGNGDLLIPKTLQELENMLQALKGTGSDGKPIMSGRRTVSWAIALNEIEAQLLGLFTETPGDFIDQNGVIKPKQFDPGYKEFLRTLNRWYNSGYVDDQLFNATYDGTAAMLRDGNTGISGSNIWGIEYGALRAIDKANPNMEIRFMGYMDEDIKMYPSLGYGTDIYLIPYTSKNYKVCLQFINWCMYNEENYMLIFNGIEDKTYVVNDGFIDVPQKFKDKGITQPYQIMGRFMIGGNVEFNTKYKVASTPSEAYKAYDYALSIPNEKIYVAPTTYTNTKLDDELQLKKSTADKNMNEAIQAIIKGEPANFDSAYDAMLSKYQQDGGLEAYIVYTNIYNSLKINK